MVICGVFVSLEFLCILFYRGLHIKYIVIDSVFILIDISVY